MGDVNTLWGDVRSWAHGVYDDDVVRLGELESILEYAPVAIEDEPALADYLKRHLEPLAPHAPEPRDPELMRVWLSGQLLAVLAFMHDDPNIARVPRQEESQLHQRRLAAYYANLEYDDWAYHSRIRGAVDAASAQAVYDYLSNGLEWWSRSALRLDTYSRPERVAGTITDLEALEWSGVSEYTFSWDMLSSGYGLGRQFSARMKLKRESAELDLLGPSKFPVGLESLFELLVQLSRRSPRYAPQFVSRHEEAKESFEALWRCVRAIRTRR